MSLIDTKNIILMPSDTGKVFFDINLSVILEYFLRGGGVYITLV